MRNLVSAGWLLASHTAHFRSDSLHIPQRLGVRGDVMTKNNNAIVFRSRLLYFMDPVLFGDSDHKVGQGVGLEAPWPGP